MQTRTNHSQTVSMRLTAFVVALSLLAPLCLAPAAFAQDPPPQGMSTKKKVVLLVGAAALLYMYKRHRDAKNQPANVQYYRSEKNGRIYYRDPKTHQAHFVTPPAQGIQVPEDEAQGYSGYRGYNNARTGQAYGGY